MRQIKFTDGTTVEVCGDYVMSPYTIYNYARACFLYRDLNNNIGRQWNGTKTDYDHNEWKIENNVLTVSAPNNTILVSVSLGSSGGGFITSYVSPDPNKEGKLCFIKLGASSGSYGYIDGYNVLNGTGNQTWTGRMNNQPDQETRNCVTSVFGVQWYMGGNSYVGGPGAGMGGTYVDLSRFENSYEETDDPYSPGGSSGTGGGTGDFDGTGDDIDIPSLPTLSAVDTGFITLFNPSAGELRNLANYMWSNPLFDLDAWKKIFADPMDAILGLSIVPVAVPNGGSSAVTVGNISTGVSMTKAGAQYISVDCGTLNVNEFWGAYLDYDPFTKAEIYLPYIGTHPLAVDDIMGKAVHVVYHVDILSGACCAYIKCGGSVLYSFVGQCSCSIPITGNDWTNVVNGALSIAASIGTMVATGGASAPMAAGAIASAAVNSMKPNVEKSGSMGGMGGMLGVQTPYLILTRPRQALPLNQNKFSGYPSFITRKLSGVSGYTEIDSIHLENIPATEQELSEIENLLKGGVIL